MDYLTIVNTALGFADRQDQEVVDNMDNFLLLVEAAVNRELDTQKMSVQAYIPTSSSSSRYGLPADYNGMRHITLNGKSLTLVTPEQLTTRKQINSEQGVYTILANQLHLNGAPDDGQLMIDYYRKVPHLSPIFENNWLATDNPDCYIQGLLVEINSFVKDGQAAGIWQSRFASTLESISNHDSKARWAGPPLHIRTA